MNSFSCIAILKFRVETHQVTLRQELCDLISDLILTVPGIDIFDFDSIMDVGKKFSTFADLKQALESWRKETYQTFAIRRSRKFPESCKYPELAASLDYTELEYGCIYGGHIEWKGTGKRPIQQTRKDKCPVFF